MNKNTLFIQGRFFLPRCHLALYPALPPVTHTTLWNTIIFPACNVCLTLWNTKDKQNQVISLTIPSVVHLTDCILPVLSTPGSL